MLRHAPTRKSVIMSVVVRLLVKWGATVERIYREERVTDLAPLKVEHDLYVLKSSTELALSLAGALQAMGANLLNPNPNSAIMRDKVAATSNAPSQLVLDVLRNSLSAWHRCKTGIKKDVCSKSAKQNWNVGASK